MYAIRHYELTKTKLTFLIRGSSFCCCCCCCCCCFDFTHLCFNKLWYRIFSIRTRG